MPEDDIRPLTAEPLTGGVVRRTDRLADGRELIYYDDADTTLPAERRIDGRALDPRPETASMRRDVLTGEWITVAANRQNRAMLPPAELDPLAPQSETNPSEVPSVYDVAVFENRSPSLGPALAEATGGVPQGDDAPQGLDDLAAPGLGRTRTAIGRCEVVCFSPERTGSFGTQSVARARTVIEAWADRTAALSALPGVEQVFPFENRGEQIGVTLHHPHGQIYSYPYVTPRTQALLRQIDAEGPDLFERILAFELAGPRTVIEAEHWVAYVPFAARWPVEAHLVPRRHAADFTELTGDERDELAHVYLRLLRGVDALYDDPTPYIAAWHQAPVSTGRDAVRMHLQLTSPRRAADKLKFLAGSEAAMSAWTAEIPPEKSAERLRDAIARAGEVDA
ncbi:galactose-1-phosphate uridylyltransferase [Microbacterium sp. gxy059]|uniref:galactose-1-phosphate uridylyltransferase n=1 Tax=Microbacterium sp. gxy059 TaxID=2957199 RepID=UPI003D9991A9